MPSGKLIKVVKGTNPPLNIKINGNIYIPKPKDKDQKKDIATSK